MSGLLLTYHIYVGNLRVVIQKPVNSWSEINDRLQRLLFFVAGEAVAAIRVGVTRLATNTNSIASDHYLYLRNHCFLSMDLYNNSYDTLEAPQLRKDLSILV